MLKFGIEQITGCLLGGAIGDALGAPIEFLTIDQIRETFGPAGIDMYVEHQDGFGVFTDDTQMTLFTAEGLLRARHREMLSGEKNDYSSMVYQSYLRWYYTQNHPPIPKIAQEKGNCFLAGWLMEQPGLYQCRAPGNTCLGSLASGECGTVENRLNNSKGCGGVMRVAPVGLMFSEDPELAFKIGVETAAITHSHPSGYLSAGCLAAILAFLVQGEGLLDAILETMALLEDWQKNQECKYALQSALDKYQTLDPTPESIETLGGGWVGEEALAISLFCALHFQNDFRGGVLAAVNHSGDSDSTGAITGNLLGLMLGGDTIPESWVANLEMADVVEKISRDLVIGIKNDTNIPGTEWRLRYPAC